jgi:hypothetical protein
MRKVQGVWRGLGVWREQGCGWSRDVKEAGMWRVQGCGGSRDVEGAGMWRVQGVWRNEGTGRTRVCGHNGHACMCMCVDKCGGSMREHRGARGKLCGWCDTCGGEEGRTGGGLCMHASCQACGAMQNARVRMQV